MSSSPGTTNSGGARPQPHAPKPSFLARRGPLIAAGTAILGAAYFYTAYRPPTAEGTVKGNLMRTTGVENIEKAYTSGGATSTHTKAYGGTTQGEKNDENLREGGGSGVSKGLNKSSHLGDDQRPTQAGPIEKEFKDMNYRDQRGK